MPRRACRKDAIHDDLSNCARRLGWQVWDTWQHAQYTPGFPDGIVVYGERVLFVEVKAHEKATLTDDEALFRSLYADVYRVVATVEDVMEVVREMRDVA